MIINRKSSIDYWIRPLILCFVTGAAISGITICHADDVTIKTNIYNDTISEVKIDSLTIESGAFGVRSCTLEECDKGISKEIGTFKIGGDTISDATLNYITGNPEGNTVATTTTACSYLAQAHVFRLIFGSYPFYHVDDSADKLTWSNQGVIGISSGDFYDEIYDKLYDCVNKNTQNFTGGLQGMYITQPAGDSKKMYRFKWAMNKLEKGGTSTDYNLHISDVPQNITKFDEVIVFGDSLSDNHNIFQLTAGNCPRSLYYNGRFTNGPNWVDQIQLKLGCPVYNFAVGGAEALRSYDQNIYMFYGTIFYGTIRSSGLVYYVPGLVDQYKIFAKNTDLLTKLKNKNVLFIILIGGNDFHAWATGKTNKDKDADGLGKMVAQKEISVFSALRNLASGNNINADFVVVNLPKIGGCPAFAYKKTDADNYVKSVNATLSSDTGLKKIGVKIFDMETCFDKITVDTDNLYGFTDVHGNLSGSTDKDGNDYNSFNFMGYDSFNPGKPWPGPIGSYTLNTYGGAKVNTVPYSDRIHPTAKIHDLISNDIIRFFNSNQSDQWITGINDVVKNILTLSPADPVLIDYADKQTQFRPDFAQGYTNN